MDTKETITRSGTITGTFFSQFRFPVIGFIFVLIASTVFYYVQINDKQIWQSLYGFHTEHLLSLEKNLYPDFYSKRLSIDRLGSQTQLDKINTAALSKNLTQLSQYILKDRGFREYLSQKAPIYFSTAEKEHWITHNTRLTEQLHELSTYKFAIIPEVFIFKPSFASLFTHIFIDDELGNFLSNIFILLILSSVFERYLRRSIYALVITYSALAMSCAYLLIGTSFSPPLHALNGLIYILILALATACIKTIYQTKYKHAWYLLFALLAIFAAKIGFDLYFNFSSKELFICLVPLGIISAILSWFYSFSQKTQTHSNQAPTTSLYNTGLSTSFRKQYAEGLSGLSRFNFKYARQVMQQLREANPDSLQILESAYHLEKLYPEDDHFWLLAKKRIDYCLETHNYEDMLSTFTDIQKAAPNRKLASEQISPDHYLKMLVIFLDYGDIEKAEHALMFLELAGKPILLKEACNLLIESFSRKHNMKKVEHYQALFKSYDAS